MSVIEINWKPTDRQLRQFAAAMLVGLPLLGWLFSGRPTPATWEPFHTSLIGGLALAGLALGIVGLAAPKLIKPLFLAATLAAFPIGMVVSEVMLLAMYFVIFLPVAVVFRLIGRDALDRGLNRSAATYWQPKRQAPDARSYFRQS